MDKVQIKINDKDFEVENGMTVLQACELAGENIPRFCYHDRLSIAGNCRMCLVEVKPGPPKPQASCALPVANNMEIITNSDVVKKARQGVMEFLLINHPLDCPICDQGGECDLQDQAMVYGSGLSRYIDDKRAVTNKEMGPLINTVMTRCIHCTRCVRFSTEVAGVEDMGLLNRGENAEISTLEKAVASELSGNVIDLCPVGALTSKPYQFIARPWELKKTETIDVLDAVGSNIRVDSRGNEVLRILPRLHEDINEEWISDKTRFAFDALKYQRLDRVYARNQQGQLEETSWDEAIATIVARLKKPKHQFASVSGNFTDIETLYMMNKLCDIIGSPHRECRIENENIGSNMLSYFNSGYANIEQADAILIIGANPRKEAPIVNARIRKSFLQNHCAIGVLGCEEDLTYPYEFIGHDLSVLSQTTNHPFLEYFVQCKKPMIILGVDAVAHEESLAIQYTAQQLLRHSSNGWNGYNLLHRYTGRVNGLYCNFLPQENARYHDYASLKNACKKGAIDSLYLLGVDEHLSRDEIGDVFVIYQGHHGDVGAQMADIILPSCAYTEKTATYINMESRVQMTQKAVFAPPNAKEDWQIINHIIQALEPKKAFADQQALYANIYEDDHHLMALDHIIQHSSQTLEKKESLKGVLHNKFDNFYQSCVLSKNSPTMASCASVFLHFQDRVAD